MNNFKILKMNPLKITLSSIILFLLSNISFAQTTTAADEGIDMNSYNTALLIVLVVLIHIIFLPLVFSGGEIKPEEAEEKESSFETLKKKFYGLRPMEEEKSLIIDEDYDGIQELNNNVPPWFNVLFAATIVFAVVYLLDYHVFNTGKLPLQEYNDEVYAAEIQREELIRTGAFINENSVVRLEDAESLSEGKKIFTVNCVPCHGTGGEGTVGPNLTDEFWIHGGGVKNIFKTVKYGVPVKGMISWQTQLNPKKMQMVVSYVMSLQGSNPPGGKAPEGEKFTAQDSSAVKNDTLKSSNVKSDTVKTGSTTSDSMKTNKDNKDSIKVTKSDTTR